MAADQNSSIEEILAACRAADGGGAGAEPAPPAQAAATPPPAAAAPATPPPASGGATPSQSMSVAEMLAAARGEAAGGSAEAAPPAAAAASAAAAPASGGKKPSQSMSVAEMLAAARGEKAGAAPAAGKAPAAAASKAPAAAKAAPPSKKANPRAATGDPGPRDTSSILAAARKSDSERRGPMSKTQAAELGKAPSKAKVAPPMPEKPAYATAKPKKSAADSENRRGVLSMFFGSFLALGFSCLGGVAGLWTLGLARYLFPNILTEPPSQFKIGFPADFPPDSVITKFKAQFGVWVVNAEYDGQQQITALMSVCTHLGCTPNWLEGEQKFKCPCHGSGFYKDGINFEGPAPRPLERYAIKIADDGQLEIDKSKSFQQEMGDWKDPSCYVPV